MTPISNSASHAGIALVVGASGGIAQALIHALCSGTEQQSPPVKIVAISQQSPPQPCPASVEWIATDYSQEHIQTLCQNLAARPEPVTQVFICNGKLHDPNFMPERKLESFDYQVFSHILAVNLGVATHFIQQLVTVLKHDVPCTLTCLSARVGSITDNRLGGWYSYRMSKAALNMFIKTAAIEYARRAKNVKLIAFHPGTTDTHLSEPFQSNVKAEKLFTPEFVAGQLLTVLQSIEFDNQPEFLDWQGNAIEW